MKDQIIYCSDLEALKEKLKENGFYNEESGIYNVPHSLTPIVKKDNKSLSLARNFEFEVGQNKDEEGNIIPSEWEMLESLGSYEYMFSNPEALAKYKEVYPYDVPFKYVDEDGVEHEYFLPEKIGEFA